MSFLDELESTEQPEKAEKTPRQLWESCFKYFKHFTSILKKNNDEFESKFNLNSLNIIQDCIITGPFEVNRSQTDQELILEVKMITQLKGLTQVHRKDKRSAELLTIKLNKEGISSTVKSGVDGTYDVELNNKIISIFKIILHDNTSFQIKYKNITISNNRTIKLPLENINQEYMDKLAKYILGKNPTLYTESISKMDISRIRDKLSQDKLNKKIQEKKIQEEIKKQEELEKIKKANTVKEKSKKYLSDQGSKLKKKIFSKFKMNK